VPSQITSIKLKILQERQQVLDEVFEEANQRIHQVSDDQEAYATLLEGLILQSAYSLMEPEMVIRCREKDVDAVNDVLEAVADKYEETMKHRPTFTISEEYLPESR
jgi:V-type H+-transporting ATPase subunit E